MHIHGRERDGLFTDVPSDIVPADFGGSATAYKGDMVADAMCDLIQRCCTDDSCRYL